jgi:hypothetical protein
MEQLIDPEQFVGMRGIVAPRDDDPFLHSFDGLCIGVRHGLLQVRDMEDDVHEVEVSQFTPKLTSEQRYHRLYVPSSCMTFDYRSEFERLRAAAEQAAAAGFQSEAANGVLDCALRFYAGVLPDSGKEG